MAEQDNITNEKINLDFTEDLNDDYGIKDTQVIASKELNSFLLSDPKDISRVTDEDEEQEVEDKTKNQNQQPNPNEKNTKNAKPKAKEEEKPDGGEVLNNILFGEEDEEEGTPIGTKDPVTQKPNDAGSEGGDDTFTTLGRDLLRLGVFQKNSEDESEENLSFKTGEEFLERFNLEKKKGAINIIDNFLSQYGEDYRKMFDAVFVNGIKPEEYLKSFAKIESIKGIDLSSEDNQERIVRSYYKNLKWDDQKIETRISKLRDYGDLEDEAKTYHQVLLDKEEEELNNREKVEQEKRVKEKEKELNSKKSYQKILSDKFKTQEFDGIPVTQKDVEETISYLTEKKYKLASGELLSEFDKDIMELNNPENHELKVKLGLLLKKKLDLSSVKKTAVSKKSDSLFTLSTKNAKQAKTIQDKEVKSFF